MKAFTLSLIIYFSLMIPSYSGMIYQDFENNKQAGWKGSCCVKRSEAARSGSYSFQATCDEDWGTFFVNSQSGSWTNDLIQKNNDRLTFWVYALPIVETDNNIAVRIYDQFDYKKDGTEAWTDHNAISEHLTHVNLSRYCIKNHA